MASDGERQPQAGWFRRLAETNFVFSPKGRKRGSLSGATRLPLWGNAIPLWGNAISVWGNAI